MAGRLNDNEVAQEMNKMVAFIKQEALEKARETKIKGKLVRQESTQIESFFQKKVKQFDIQRKISHSHLINKSRLQVLGTKQQSLQDVFMETKLKLIDLTKDAQVYQSLLVNLLLQGFYRLMEPSVMVQVRQQDISIVQSAIETACKEYEKTLGIKISCIIDEKNQLPSSSCGGVILGSLDWTIKCSNTLESRLELLQDQMLPDIRTMLFGPSPNRKFFN